MVWRRLQVFSTLLGGKLVRRFSGVYQLISWALRWRSLVSYRLKEERICVPWGLLMGGPLVAIFQAGLGLDGKGVIRLKSKFGTLTWGAADLTIYYLEYGSGSLVQPAAARKTGIEEAQFAWKDYEAGPSSLARTYQKASSAVLLFQMYYSFGVTLQYCTSNLMRMAALTPAAMTSLCLVTRPIGHHLIQVTKSYLSSSSLVKRVLTVS